MSICDSCDSCRQLWDIDSLVYVEYTKQNMCSVCINELIWNLLEKQGSIEEI